MGKYLIVNERVFFAHEKEEGWVSWEEFASADFIKEVPATVLLTETEFRKSKSLAQSGADKSEDSARIFPSNMLVQEELLKNGIRQCVGVRSDRLQMILNRFPQGSVRVCIPYALSIRAFLIARGLYQDGGVSVVLEDAGGVVLLTMLEGMEVVAVRVLAELSLDEIAEELMRSLKRANLEVNAQARFIVNTQALLDMLVDEAVCSSRQTVVVETPRLAFDAIERATFRINFLLPEEIARQQRHVRRRRYWGVCGVVVLVVGLAAAYAGYGVYVKNEAVMRERASRLEMGRAKTLLEEKSVKVFNAALRQEQGVNYERVFQALLLNIPGGWTLEKVLLQKQEKTTIAIEAFFSGTQHGVFMCDGLFKECQVQDIFVSGKPGAVVKAWWRTNNVEQGER